MVNEKVSNRCSVSNGEAHVTHNARFRSGGLEAYNDFTIRKCDLLGLRCINYFSLTVF